MRPAIELAVKVNPICHGSIIVSMKIPNCQLHMLIENWPTPITKASLQRFAVNPANFLSGILGMIPSGVVTEITLIHASIASAMILPYVPVYFGLSPDRTQCLKCTNIVWAQITKRDPYCDNSRRR